MSVAVRRDEIGDNRPGSNVTDSSKRHHRFRQRFTRIVRIIEQYNLRIYLIWNPVDIVLCLEAKKQFCELQSIRLTLIDSCVQLMCGIIVKGTHRGPYNKLLERKHDTQYY